MPGIFLSHSSTDKPLVRRIAGELLLERIPVWLDQWEMGVGDSLDRTLASALQGADYMGLCISRSAVQSGWVERELDMALAHERRLGRVFVLPIRIDDTEVPLRVADRIYADLATSVPAGLRQLVSRIRADRRNHTILDQPHVIYPLLFLADGITVNTDRFSEYLSWIRLAHADAGSCRSKVVVIETPGFQRLIDRWYVALDKAQERPESKHLADFQSFSRELDRARDLLIAGSEEIINALLRQRSHDAAIAVHWFAKEAQARRLKKMASALEEGDELCKTAARFDWDDLKLFRSLYEAEDVRKMDFWQDRQGVSGPERSIVSGYLDVREDIWESLRCSRQFGLVPAICDAADSFLIGPKYLIPRQMWYWFGARTWGGRTQPLEWDFEGWSFGPG